MSPNRGIATAVPALLWLAAVIPVAAHQDHGHDHGHGDGGHAAHAAEQRRHGVHVHGTATLNLALGGRELHIEVESPAANLVGFEHAPTSPAEAAALAEAAATLRDGATLFGFAEGAACRLAEAGVASPLLGDAVADAAHDHDHDRAATGGHAGSAHGHPGEAHADIVARYRFDCAGPDRVTQVTVRLFEAFPGVEKLQVQYLTDDTQGAAQLTASDPVLAF